LIHIVITFISVIVVNVAYGGYSNIAAYNERDSFMEGISDIRICGFDEKRPPTVTKQKPYIDLFFKLVHQAPKDWCEDFNSLVSKGKYSAKITPDTGLFIETWVRTPDEIESTLATLKNAVTTCTQEYIAKIEKRIKAAENAQEKPGDAGEQGKLNKIIAALNFDS
jgi:hypothetical protein